MTASAPDNERRCAQISLPADPPESEALRDECDAGRRMGATASRCVASGAVTVSAAAPVTSGNIVWQWASCGPLSSRWGKRRTRLHAERTSMTASSSVLRVASWNVHEGHPVVGSISDQAVRREIAELLLSYQVDIVGLQEVGFDSSERSYILEAIQHNTPLEYIAHNILSSSSFSQDGSAGVALASRYPLADLRCKYFSNPELGAELDGIPIRSHDKGIISATVTLPGLEISVVSLHTIPFRLFGREANESDFEPLWSELSAELKGLAVRPLIVCGDFNTDQRDLASKSIGTFLTRSVVDEPTHKGRSIDDILYSQGFRPTSVKVLSNFSDHRLCIAELGWKG